MTHGQTGQCDARRTVTSPAAEHRRPLTGTKLLVTEAHECEQLAQSCYPSMERPGVEPATSRSQVQLYDYTTEPPSMAVVVLVEYSNIRILKFHSFKGHIWCNKSMIIVQLDFT